MKKTIKSKIIIFVGIIILLVVSLQIIFNVFLAKPYFMAEKSNKMEQLFLKLKESHSQEEDEIAKIIHQYEESDNLKVVVINQTSEMIYGSSQEDFNFWRKPTPQMPQIKDKIVFSKNPKPVLQKNYRTDEESLMLNGVIKLDDQNIYVIIYTSISGVAQSARVLTVFSLYISIICLIIGGISAYILANKISKPIKEIDEVAKNVAKLNFTKKANINLREDEIGSLANNINIMSDTLSNMISELTQANESLQKDVDYQKQIDKMRKEFIANVSHELKTPLSLLIGYSEMLKNNIEGIDKDFYYEVIIDEGQKMNDLVKSLLDVSSIENKLTKMIFEKTDLGEIAKQISSKSEVLFSKNQNICKTNIQENCLVQGDRIYLERAMKNYIQNAISHTKPGDKIEVSVKKNEENIVFSVFNQGENIEKEHFEKIWDSFYRSDEARTRSEESNVGLGLYIVKTIIDAHGGQCGLENLKNGVEFWFSLKCI